MLCSVVKDWLLYFTITENNFFTSSGIDIFKMKINFTSISMFKNHFRYNKAEKSTWLFVCVWIFLLCWVLCRVSCGSTAWSRWFMQCCVYLAPLRCSCPAERGLGGDFVLFDYRVVGGGAMIALSFWGLAAFLKFFCSLLLFISDNL